MIFWFVSSWPQDRSNAHKPIRHSRRRRRLPTLDACQTPRPVPNSIDFLEGLCARGELQIEGIKNWLLVRYSLARFLSNGSQHHVTVTNHSHSSTCGCPASVLFCCVRIVGPVPPLPRLHDAGPTVEMEKGLLALLLLWNRVGGCACWEKKDAGHAHRSSQDSSPRGLCVNPLRPSSERPCPPPTPHSQATTPTPRRGFHSIQWLRASRRPRSGSPASGTWRSGRWIMYLLPYIACTSRVGWLAGFLCVPTDWPLPCNHGPDPIHPSRPGRTAR